MSGARNSEATRERILDAAAILFAERGFDNVSLRDITAHGLANVAAVNYHFGTKEALWEKVLEKVILPLNAVRKRGLESLGADADLGDVVGVWLDPIFEVMEVVELGSDLFCRLVGRFMDGEVEASEGLNDGELRRSWVEVLAGVLGDSSGLEWRVGFVMGAVRSALLGEFREEDVRGMLERLKRFCVGGLGFVVCEVVDGESVVDKLAAGAVVGADVESVVDEVVRDVLEEEAEVGGDLDDVSVELVVDEVVVEESVEAVDKGEGVVEEVLVEDESPFVRSDVGGESSEDIVVAEVESESSVDEEVVKKVEDLVAEEDSDVKDDGVQDEFWF